MVSFVSLTSALLAAALPSTWAWNYPPPLDLCDDFAVEIYRYDLPARAKLQASVDAYAYGDDTFTYSDQYAVQSPGRNSYWAYLGGYGGDQSYVVLYNQGSGKAVDCAKVLELEYVEVPGLDCVYEVDWRTRKACTKALSHWNGYAYVEGGSANISVDSVQSTGYAASSQYLYASGSYVSAGLSNSDEVVGENGSHNGGSASLGVTASGGQSTVSGGTQTHANGHSSGSSSTLNVNTKGRRMM